MLKRLREASLALQLPMAAALAALLVAILLVALSYTASRHLLSAQESELGDSLAAQLAYQASRALETGELLNVAALLQRFLASAPVDELTVYDIDGQAIGHLGESTDTAPVYRAPVLIGDAQAGEVALVLTSQRPAQRQWRFLLSLGSLAVLLSILVFLLLRPLAVRLATHLEQLERSLRLAEPAPGAAPPGADNEITRLAGRIAELPLDLLRHHGAPTTEPFHYRPHAILFIHLESLAGYVATLDERHLQRYTDRIHRIVYAGAACYRGTLSVSRQFGLCVCFGPGDSAASPALRACSCAWLIRSVAERLERHMSLSLGLRMALSHSELGPGDSSDIYPGLYLQATLDELQQQCTRSAALTLDDTLARDPELKRHARLEGEGRPTLLGFPGGHGELIDRQRDLILQRFRRRREAAES